MHNQLDLSNKLQVIRDIIGKVVIKERSEVEVICHISLTQLSLTSAEKLEHEPISRDSWNRNRHFEANYIPFELKFRLPPLRKWRIISERDELGKIISSSAP